ncbi:MAG: pseudouridine synthase [Oceanobacter sp.]
MAQLILFNKPYHVLSQFTDKEERQTLSSHIDISNVYPAGRLDYDSEGLLLLTDDGSLQARIADPKHKMEKTYWVQVEGTPDDSALEKLRKGVELKDGMTRPAKVEYLSQAIDKQPPSQDWQPDLWERNPPVRQRKNDDTCWLEIKISEGRNRQVRRMTSAIGHPTLRLVRHSIGSWKLNGLNPGEFRSLTIHMPKPHNSASKRSRSNQNKARMNQRRRVK